MFLLNTISTEWWVISFFICIILVVVTKVLPFKFGEAFHWLAIALVLLNTYALGAKVCSNSYQTKIQALTEKILEAEVRASNINTEVVVKYVTKTQVIREKANEITKYVDREIVKYDTTCIIPVEVIQAHNEAAK